MSREFDSNDDYEAWVLERGRQEDEDRYWAEQEAREQERYAYWEAEMNAERDYYCYMAQLFWYANGFYDYTPPRRGRRGKMSENRLDTLCEFCGGWIDQICPVCGDTFCINCDTELHDEYCNTDDEEDSD